MVRSTLENDPVEGRFFTSSQRLCTGLVLLSAAHSNGDSCCKKDAGVGGFGDVEYFGGSCLFQVLFIVRSIIR